MFYRHKLWAQLLLWENLNPNSVKVSSENENESHICYKWIKKTTLFKDELDAFHSIMYFAVSSQIKRTSEPLKQLFIQYTHICAS